MKFQNFDSIQLSYFKQLIFYIKKIPIFAGMTLKRKIYHSTRTKEIVLKSYDQSTWKKILEKEPWKNAKTLTIFVDTPMEKIFGDNIENKWLGVINGKLSLFSYNTKSKLQKQLLTETLKKFVKNNDKIIEIGCGYGRNLFSLRDQGFQNEITGYDFSENSISAAKKINNYFNSEINFDVVDMTKDLRSKNLKNKLIFTFHSFEQIKYDTKTVIEDLINSDVSQVIHFEPISELYGYDVRDITSFLYIKARDYQDNLLKTLKDFEKIGKLKILQCERTNFAENPFHETCLIRWTPTS